MRRERRRRVEVTHEARSEIERLAREKLGYVRPGEVAYVVLEPPFIPTTTTQPPAEDPPVEDRSLLSEVWDFVTGADLSG